jgi:hypothetical protein
MSSAVTRGICKLQLFNTSFLVLFWLEKICWKMYTNHLSLYYTSGNLSATLNYHSKPELLSCRKPSERTTFNQLKRCWVWPAGNTNLITHVVCCNSRNLQAPIIQYFVFGYILAGKKYVEKCTPITYLYIIPLEIHRQHTEKLNYHSKSVLLSCFQEKILKIHLLLIFCWKYFFFWTNCHTYQNIWKTSKFLRRDGQRIYILFFCNNFVNF